MAWLRGFLYSVRHSVSLDPDNVNRLCKHMCPCYKRACSCFADSYVLTTSVCIADLAIKVVYFVVLMGIWRINFYYAALWLEAIDRCLVLAVVTAYRLGWKIGRWCDVATRLMVRCLPYGRWCDAVTMVNDANVAPGFFVWCTILRVLGSA